jgi:hypothetical protein
MHLSIDYCLAEFADSSSTIYTCANSLTFRMIATFHNALLISNLSGLNSGV